MPTFDQIRAQITRHFLTIFRNFNADVLAECNVLLLDPATRDLIRNHVILDLKDCAIITSRIPIQIAPNGLAQFSIPSRPHFLAKGTYGLKNDVIIFRSEFNEHCLLIKPRIRYTNESERLLIPSGSRTKVVKPFGLLIRITPSTPNNTTFEYRRVVTWGREQIWSESDEYGERTAQIEHMSPETKLQYLEQLVRDGETDGWTRLDYAFIFGEVCIRRTIFYQTYSGINMQYYQNMQVQAEQSLTMKAKLQLIFSYLNSILKVIKNGRWPNDLRLNNTCVEIGQNGSQKCNIIDYYSSGGSTVSLFKKLSRCKQPELVAWNIDRFKKILHSIRNRFTHPSYLAMLHRTSPLNKSGSGTYWDELQHELVFEILHMCLIIMHWPYVHGLCKAHYNEPTLHMHAHEVDTWTVQSYLPGDCTHVSYTLLSDLKSPLYTIFTWFRRELMRPYGVKTSRFNAFDAFLKRLKQIETQTASKTHQVLPWPEEFNARWIGEFVQSVDRFLPPLPQPQATCAATARR